MNILNLLRPKSTVCYIHDNKTMRQGLEAMHEHGYTALPVISSDGVYVGTISEGDFLWHLMDAADACQKVQEEYHISDILRPNWNPAVRISATMEDLLTKVMDQNFVPVVDDRDLFVGIITRKDIILALTKHIHGTTVLNV